MTTDAPIADASNPNPGGSADTSQGESNAPQGKPADAPSVPEGQGDKPADAPKPSDTPEAKPEDEKPAEGAPEQYEQFSLPEGFALEGERLEATVALFKRAGLSQAEAQAEVERFTANVGNVLGEQHAKTVEDWGKQLKEDAEFGGPGFEANLDTTGKFVAEIGGQPLIDVLDQYGIGNNPALCKAMLKAATTITDLQRKLRVATGEPSDMPGSGTVQSGGASIAERMYPSMGKT